MVTKHSNGTLNLWQLTFAFKTKFTQVLSIGHVSRASGHRFRVNDITCHPVLPLLVSTSHHNLPDSEAKSPMSLFEQPLSGGLPRAAGLEPVPLVVPMETKMYLRPRASVRS